ncbi:ADP-ribosylglycohydrolase family protein [Methylorubrum rhodesianum]|uniref:ADP-ribosylglycohydrolase family protein n=1 Tax=Methylorubrum rhodesianum TaxID=29427 RepID=UPI001FE44AE8|nr:ADP-ribosylglycohydrolase family protein [Methylorubrum rhodesianum]
MRGGWVPFGRRSWVPIGRRLTEAALWCVGSSGSFSEAVLKAVNLGDDADTTGAIAGQLAGAFYGVSGIPERWRKRLAWNDRIEGLADRLFTESVQ